MRGPGVAGKGRGGAGARSHSPANARRISGGGPVRGRRRRQPPTRSAPNCRILRSLSTHSKRPRPGWRRRTPPGSERSAAAPVWNRIPLDGPRSMAWRAQRTEDRWTKVLIHVIRRPQVALGRPRPPDQARSIGPPTRKLQATRNGRRPAHGAFDRTRHSATASAWEVRTGRDQDDQPARHRHRGVWRRRRHCVLGACGTGLPAEELKIAHEKAVLIRDAYSGEGPDSRGEGREDPPPAGGRGRRLRAPRRAHEPPFECRSQPRRRGGAGRHAEQRDPKLLEKQIESTKCGRARAWRHWRR